jgi:hypothetical protein
MDYYRLMVRGWLKGQLYLDKQPSPELLALADPYDPAQNGPYKLGDATYFKGHYYLYFGVAPAFTLMLPYRLITGGEMYMGTAVFVFLLLAFFTATGLWLMIRRRYFPESSAWIAPLGVLGLGFGTHLLALAQRPMIWELPIAGGVAFTLLAVAGGYWAIHGRRPQLAMALAGLSLGLAVASRPTCLFAAPLLLAPLWLAWRERKPGRAWWKMALAAAVPLGACGLMLMAHNYARFGNVFEFGQHYQLSGAYEGKLVHFSPRFIGYNFAVYFFQPLKWTWEFPFALAWGDERHLPRGYFGTEEVCGIALTLPFVWLVLALPLAWRRRTGDDARTWTATACCIGGYAIPVLLVILSWFSTCARYQADFAVVLGLVAAGGLLALERAAQQRNRRALLVSFAAVVCLVTVVMGTLLSFDYHGRSMRRSAPLRWQKLGHVTHLALSHVGRWLGHVEGPRVLKVRFKPQPVGTVETFWRAIDARAEERIVVEHTGDHLIRFGYARGTAPITWGRLLKWETDHTHTVSVQLPSLYGATNRGLSGLRKTEEFRERSSAAVWFSGGRALGTVAPQPPVDLVIGGEVGADFSGEVRGITMRLFRPDEVGPAVPVDQDAPRGGTLRMRVIVPDRLHEEGEPLFSAGAHYRSSILFVRAVEGGVKFYYENYATCLVESELVRPSPAGHTLEIELPACGPERFGKEATGDVVMRVDGREVMRSRQVCYEFFPGNEEIGRNPFGTTCGPEFRGWLLDVQWVRAD